MSILLAPEEYIEQEFFFGAMRERLNEYATQELLRNVKFEILSNTKLPLAVDFMATEMMHRGTMGSAMARLPHYFSPFQVFIITEAEKEEGRFDFRVGLEILQALAKYYSTIELIPGYSESDFRDRTDGIPIDLSYTEGRGLKGPSHFITPQGIFLFEIEVISRNRLDYESGLAAMAEDPIFHPDFKEWVRIVGRQLGFSRQRRRRGGEKYFVWSKRRANRVGKPKKRHGLFVRVAAASTRVSADAANHVYGVRRNQTDSFGTPIGFVGNKASIIGRREGRRH